MRRREVLGYGGSAVLGALAGCITGSSGSGPDDLAPPWRREGEVYHPGHRMAMAMIDTAQQGEVTVGLSYSYPERFWTIAGTRRQRVAVEDRPSGIHLMASVWHTETETVLPVDSGLRVTVNREGERVTERALWPMLSQTMGFHYGDNIRLPEWGEYTVAVDTGSASIEQRGPLQGAFEGTGTVEFEFRFLLSRRNEIAVDRVPDQRGRHEAVAPMQMERLPLSYAPSERGLPERIVGQGESGDAVFVITATETADGTYLAVNPRTPFNQFVLPLMSLSATIERGGTTVFEGPLTAAIDPERSYHYGATVDGIERGDEVTVSVDAPPQTARHIGYESAFLEMSDVRITV